MEESSSVPVASEESKNVDNLNRALSLCSPVQEGKTTEGREESADAKSSEKQLLCDEAEPEHLVTQIAPELYEFDSASSFPSISDLSVYIPDTTWKEDQSQGEKGEEEGTHHSTTYPSEIHSSRGEPAEQGMEEEKDKMEAIDCGGEPTDVTAPHRAQVDIMDIDRRSYGEPVVGESIMVQERVLASTTSSPSNQNQSVVQATSSSQNDKVESQSQFRSPRRGRGSQMDGTDSDFLHASDSQEEQPPSMKVLRLDSLSPSPPPPSLLTSRTNEGQPPPQPHMGAGAAPEENVFDENQGELRERGEGRESNFMPSFFGDAKEFKQILLSTNWAKTEGKNSQTIRNGNVPMSLGEKSDLGEVEPVNDGESLVQKRLEKEAVSHGDPSTRRDEGSKGHEDGGDNEEAMQEPVTNTLEVDVVGVESEEEVTKSSCNVEVTTEAPSTEEMVGDTHQRGAKCVSPPHVENMTDRRSISQHIRSSSNREDVASATSSKARTPPSDKDGKKMLTINKSERGTSKKDTTGNITMETPRLSQLPFQAAKNSPESYSQEYIHPSSSSVAHSGPSTNGIMSKNTHISSSTSSKINGSTSTRSGQTSNIANGIPLASDVPSGVTGGHPSCLTGASCATCSSTDSPYSEQRQPAASTSMDLFGTKLSSNPLINGVSDCRGVRVVDPVYYNDPNLERWRQMIQTHWFAVKMKQCQQPLTRAEKRILRMLGLLDKNGPSSSL